MSEQSSLSHCTTTRPGIVAGSSGTTESRAPWAITMPPECWDRCRGRSCNRTHYSVKKLYFERQSPHWISLRRSFSVRWHEKEIPYSFESQRGTALQRDHLNLIEQINAIKKHETFSP